MKHAKHTPGAWHLFKGANEETCLAAGEEHLETLLSGEANARLIAAAPEMLNELRALSKHLETLIEAKRDLGGRGPYLLDRSRALIARIEGGKS